MRKTALKACLCGVTLVQAVKLGLFNDANGFIPHIILQILNWAL